MNVEDQIRQFTGYFREQIETVLKLRLAGGAVYQPSLSLYRKTLLVTVLDCLAGIRFNEMKQNRERFTRFVREYGNWPAGSRISVPFLVNRLDKEAPAGQLLKEARTQLKRFDPQAGNSTPLEVMDLELNDLIPLAKIEAEKKALVDVQHWSLLYRYRNFLVHESREPGYGMEVLAEDTGGACYHGYVGDPCFHLVYPLDLFRSIAQAAVDGIESHFLKQQLDPYARVEDTSTW